MLARSLATFTKDIRAINKLNENDQCCKPFVHLLGIRDVDDEVHHLLDGDDTVAVRVRQSKDLLRDTSESGKTFKVKIQGCKKQACQLRGCIE